MAKRKTRKAVNSFHNTSKALTKAMKTPTKKKASAKKKARRRSIQAGVGPAGTEAQVQERLRELTVWYMLQGMDETSARQHAEKEMSNEALE